jgi:predicted nucleic acid-binding protein
MQDENSLRHVNENLNNIRVSSITAEELLIAYIGYLHRAKSPRTSLSLPRAHEDFVATLEDLRIFPIRTFSPEAEAIFQTFPPAILRIGAQDCRIAAQAMAHDLTVVTRNIRDFEAIGARCEDWSV